MERSRKTRAIAALGLAALSWAGIGAARAEDGDRRPASHRDEGGGPGHHRPPAEAFSACEGKAEGAVCEVQFRERTLSGVCVAPKAEELFCMPDDMPPPDGTRPPPR